MVITFYGSEDLQDMPRDSQIVMIFNEMAAMMTLLEIQNRYFPYSWFWLHILVSSCREEVHKASKVSNITPSGLRVQHNIIWNLIAKRWWNRTDRTRDKHNSLPRFVTETLVLRQFINSIESGVLSAWYVSFSNFLFMWYPTGKTALTTEELIWVHLAWLLSPAWLWKSPSHYMF